MYKIKMGSYVARVIERVSAFKILSGNKSLGKPRRRWENAIRVGLKKIIVSTRNWIDSAQDRDNCGLLSSKTSELVNFPSELFLGEKFTP
jgi:hypothetical protein